MPQDNTPAPSPNTAPVTSRQVSYNLLTPKIKRNIRGEIVPHRTPPVKLTFQDKYRLLKNYTLGRFLKPFRVILPLSLFLGSSQWLVLQHPPHGAGSLLLGSLIVSLGLMLLLEGVRTGMIPFGEIIGQALPQQFPLPLVTTILFLFGTGLTLFEPSWKPLLAAASRLPVATAPHVTYLANAKALWLEGVTGVAVGLALVFGNLRVIHAWNLKPVVIGSLALALVLTLVSWLMPNQEGIIELAWGIGRATSAPIAVSLILALGTGVFVSVTHGNRAGWGLGLIGLSALFATIGVLLLALAVAVTTPTQSIIAMARETVASTRAAQPASIVDAMDSALRATLPIVCCLAIFYLFVLKKNIRNPGMLLYGMALSILGLAVFNIGMGLGLSTAGVEMELWLATLSQPSAILSAPTPSGYLACILFAVPLAFGATLGEPGLNIFGSAVESLSNGVLKKKRLILLVASGAALGTAIGVISMLFALPFAWILLPACLLAMLLALLSSEERVALAWDSGGVTPGPMAIPLILSVGEGLGGALNGPGILALAALGSIITYLALGFWDRPIPGATGE
ncbi:MAG: DUF1538 family protein [Magnetococcales bacterium]|nr:DUF1538 family protein [Magnetococcales bacterium]